MPAPISTQSHTTCGLANKSQAVIDTNQSDAKKIGGDKTTVALKHLHSRTLRSDLGPYFKAITVYYKDDAGLTGGVDRTGDGSEEGGDDGSPPGESAVADGQPTTSEAHSGSGGNKSFVAQEQLAIGVEEDGSGFAYYPSGRRALCISQKHKSRRFHAIIFQDAKNSPILGTISDWGIGKISSDQSATLGADISSELTLKNTHVTYTNRKNNKSETTTVKYSELLGANSGTAEDNLKRCTMTVNPNISVRVVPNKFTKSHAASEHGGSLSTISKTSKQLQQTVSIILDFKCENAGHSFLVGIVPPCYFDPHIDQSVHAHLSMLQMVGGSYLKHSTPNSMIAGIPLETQKYLVGAANMLTNTQVRIETEFPEPMEVLNKLATSVTKKGGLGGEMGGLSQQQQQKQNQKATRDTTHSMLKGQRLPQSDMPPMPIPHLKANANLVVAGATIANSLDETLKNLCDKLTKGRIPYNVERELAAKVKQRNPTMSRLAGTMTNSLTGEQNKVGMKYFSGKLMLGGESKLKASGGIPEGTRQWVFPRTVKTIQHDELETWCAGKKFAVACFIAPADPQSKHAIKALEVAKGFNMGRSGGGSSSSYTMGYNDGGGANTKSASKTAGDPDGGAGEGADAGVDAGAQASTGNGFNDTTYGDDGEPLRDMDFCLVDMAERGALISDKGGSHINELAKKYQVTSTPHLLIFSRGQVIYNQKLVGTVERLRSNPETMAKPRALLIEPAGTVCGERAFPYGPNNGRVSKNALIRSLIDSDLALSGREASLMVTSMTPPYRLVFASSEVPYSELENIRGACKRRTPDCLFMLIHHEKRHQVDNETKRVFLTDTTGQTQATGGLEYNPSTCDYVYRRPLATSRIQLVLSEHECTYTKFETAGQSGHQFWDMIKKIYDLRT